MVHPKALFRLPSPVKFPLPRFSRHFAPRNRTYSTSRNTSPSTNPSKTRARINRLLDRLPRSVRPWTDGLRTAPLTHLTSFLILHELTAIVPLVGLATLFHYTNWLPTSLINLRWVDDGVERFGRYFGRRGWFGFEPASPESESELEGEGERAEEMGKRWSVSEKGSRILVEVATAYAVTKLLLPVRILGCVWVTPWFARNVLGRMGRVFGRGG